MSPRSLLWFIWLCAVLPAGLAEAVTRNGFDLTDTLIPTSKIVPGGPPRDGIPSLDTPKFVAAAAAQLRQDDRVLGIFHAGQAKAYTVRILNWHEIVNDRFGADAIAVTYCPLCGTGVAFLAATNGKVHQFGVSGLLYNSDVLLYDRKTLSLWSQLQARAVSGPLKATTLTPIPMEHTSWSGWRARYPATLVLSFDTGHGRDYEHDPYAGYEQTQRLLFDVDHRDERLPLKEWVLGVKLKGKSKAYPFSRLDALAAGADGIVTLRERIGRETLTIRFDRRHRSASALDATGKLLATVQAFWFAWVAFNPDSELYTPP